MRNLHLPYFLDIMIKSGGGGYSSDLEKKVFLLKNTLLGISSGENSVWRIMANEMGED